MARSKSSASALRQRLKNQKSAMGGGVVLRNKDITKLKFRIIPSKSESEDLPGHEYWGLYSKPLKKGTSSPRAFGVTCPVLEVLDQIRNEGDAEEKAFAKEQVNVTKEYWMGILDRNDMGTAEKPVIHVLPAKRTVYEQIVNYMLDTESDDGVDEVDDPVMGRDIRITKTGQGLETEWKTKVLDRSPICEDKDDLKAYVEAAEKFEVTRYFFKVDLEVLEEMYQALTGEAIPEEYVKAINDAGICKGAKSASDDAGEGGGDDDPDAGGEDEAAEATGDDDNAEGGEDEAAAGEVVFKETRARFDNEGTIIEGTITGEETDDDGDECYLLLEDGEKEPWSVMKSLVEIIEPEPEEVPPTVEKKAAKKGAKKPEAKTPAKKGAPKKPSGKGKGVTGGIKARLAKSKK